jgi:adenylate kinase
VFYLHCTDMSKMVERLQRRALKENRLDDANLDVIRSRLEVYDSETKPLLQYYGKKLVHHIDSTQTPAAVLAQILKYAAKL